MFKKLLLTAVSAMAINSAMASTNIDEQIEFFHKKGYSAERIRKMMSSACGVISVVELDKKIASVNSGKSFTTSLSEAALADKKLLHQVALDTAKLTKSNPDDSKIILQSLTKAHTVTNIDSIDKSSIDTHTDELYDEIKKFDPEVLKSVEAIFPKDEAKKVLIETAIHTNESKEKKLEQTIVNLGAEDVLTHEQKAKIAATFDTETELNNVLRDNTDLVRAYIDYLALVKKTARTSDEDKDMQAILDFFTGKSKNAIKDEKGMKKLMEDVASRIETLTKKLEDMRNEHSELLKKNQHNIDLDRTKKVRDQVSKTITDLKSI